MDIILISAIGKNREIGKNNNLLWKIKEDMKFFKNTTLNNIVVMGYNTYLSLNTPLVNRTNYVLSRDKNKVLRDGFILVNSKEELLDKVKDKGKIFIIGGEKIYNMFINDSKYMYITHINKESKDADTYFPYFNINDYNKEIIIDNNEYKIIKYIRKDI